MNRDKVKILICAMICVTLIICGILFWPTLYRYDSMKDGKRTMSVRINRITGATEIFGELGWKKPVDGIYYEPPKILMAGEIAKLIGGKEDPFYEIGRGPLPNGSYVSVPDKNNFSFKCQLYNGSKFSIHKLMIVVEAKNKDDTTRWKRRYDANIIGQSIKPFSSGSFIVEPSDTFGVANYIWFIDEAYGF